MPESEEKLFLQREFCPGCCKSFLGKLPPEMVLGKEGA